MRLVTVQANETVTSNNDDRHVIKQHIIKHKVARITICKHALRKPYANILQSFHITELPIRKDR